MDLQIAFNIAVGIAGFLGGFVLKAVWDGLKDLRESDTKLAEKVQTIEVLVVGQYVTWEGLKDMMKPIESKLDRIMEKLDTKADKVHP